MRRPAAACTQRALGALFAFFGLFWLTGLLASATLAAPGDALLSALPERDAARAVLSLANEQLAKRVDSTRLQDGLPVPAAGRYRSQQLDAALRLLDGLWLQAALGQRDIGDGVDSFAFRHWRLSGQWRLLDAAGPRPALALRLSRWGDAAGQTTTTSAVQVPGALLDSVTIEHPADRQWQADLLATWPISQSLAVSVGLGGGHSQLSYGALAATTTRGGCHYQLAFTGNDIFGNLAQPCSAAGGVIRQFIDRSGDYGVDVASELAWQGRFVQGLANLAWRSGPWAIKAGYSLQSIRRQAIDDILAQRGQARHSTSHQAVLEAAYQLTPQLSGFVRSRWTSTLFFSDLPVAYNSSTASGLGSHYTTLALGVRAAF